MNRTDVEDYYVFIRMWCPPEETKKPKEEHFVQRLEVEEGGSMQWTLTKDFEEATLFKSANIAKRLVRAVERLRYRIERGWFYEVVMVSEEVIDHNLPSLEDEDKKEDAA